MANWDILLEAASNAEAEGKYRQALGFFNELLASAKRVKHSQMIEFCERKIDEMSELLR